jgi:hypothetical protein
MLDFDIGGGVVVRVWFILEVATVARIVRDVGAGEDVH